MNIEYKDISDKSDSFVESVMKVFDKKHILNFAINLYHTKSKIMVNGRDVDSFNHKRLKIAEVILRKKDVNMLDKEIPSTIISCLNNIEDSYAKTKPDALPRKKLAEQGQKIHTAEAGVDILRRAKITIQVIK